MRWLLTAVLVLGLSSRLARALCDPGQVVGYTLIFGKTIEAFVEEGKRMHGFAGCTRDRVLVFTDKTGVRCKETFVHTASVPKSYLFARNQNDMKLCVDDDLYEVAQAN